ncbi:major facilitator superfamily domain-containing protein [Halteromyces radiatus]|uniref:major facilitator superfamily domain-containing protein n=1 Tax=Halteromyces radiatus TaxID=101107 RepID=UPI0022208819|nr:major facilitator superfamily domain-containing protein [Halteromyces radiatus]KAI8097268.1 major facilitator superfamily domain-containing protein [Halteromyces radiatus]
MGESNTASTNISVSTTMEEKINNVNLDQKETSVDATKSVDHDLDNKAIRSKKFKRGMTFLALQVSLFLGALDGTIVSTCLPRIGSDFQEFTIASWVATAYILTFDAFQPLFAKFSDIFGRKWTLVTGICIFLLGSLLCGVAKSMIMLIICRAIAGIGSAGIFSGVFIIISEIVPLEKRGNYQGLINAVFALASVFGPLIGGGFTDNLTWRWSFYINLPIGGIALLLLILFLDMPTQKSSFVDKLKRIDYIGTFIVLVAAILFLLALNFGGEIFPWKSAAVIVPLVLTFLLACLFPVIESRFAREPILPPRLFKNRSVVSILITNWWFGLNFFAIVYYLPVYFQVVKGDSAMWSGIRLIPMQMLICVGSTSVGFLITKTGAYRPFIWFGTSIMTMHVGLISLFDVNTDFSMIYGITVVGGLGIGCMFSSTIIGLQAAVEPKDIAVVTGLGNFSRLLGAAVGIAIASSVLNSGLNERLPNLIPPEYISPVIKSSLFVRDGLPVQYQAVTLQAYADSLRLIWYIMIPLIALGILSSAFIKHYDLRRPGQKKQKQEEQPEKSTDEKNGDEVVVELPLPAAMESSSKVEIAETLDQENDKKPSN